MYYNILQYQPDSSEVTDFYTGKPVKIDLASLRNTDLPFIIGQGLKAIDRQAAAQMLQQVIFALIQAPQAAQGYRSARTHRLLDEHDRYRCGYEAIRKAACTHESRRDSCGAGC
jgi:hypothetical protein